MDIVSNFTYKTSAPAARALTVLRSVLDNSDLDKIDEWITQFTKSSFTDDPNNRLLKYCEYYKVYIPAKFSSDPGHP